MELASRVLATWPKGNVSVPRGGRPHRGDRTARGRSARAPAVALYGRMAESAELRAWRLGPRSEEASSCLGILFAPTTLHRLRRCTVRRSRRPDSYSSLEP